MTRKKAREQCEADIKQGMYVIGYSQYVNFLESLVDDLEDGICENCEHYEEKHGDCFILNIDINIMPPKFGCNRFERKIT